MTTISTRRFGLALVGALALLSTACVVSPIVADGTGTLSPIGRPPVAGNSAINPVIQAFTATPNTVQAGQAVTFQVVANDPGNQPLQYNWTATTGTLSSTTGALVSWTPPTKAGTATVSLLVTNGRGGAVSGSANIIVLDDGSAKVTIAPSSPAPSAAPSAAASTAPSAVPSAAPSASASASAAPSAEPSAAASADPSASPSADAAATGAAQEDGDAADATATAAADETN